MHKNEVRINGYYSAKISDKLTVVRIVEEHPNGGWEAVNVTTGKRIRVKSAAKLREEVEPDGTPVRKQAKAESGKPAKVAESTAKAAADAAPGGEPGDAEAESSQDTNDAEESNTRRQGATVDDVTATPIRKKMSLMDAAVKVMQETDEPINTKKMLELIAQQGLWEPSRGGKTPANTLYASILREINTKGDASRFTKVERGHFVLKNRP